MHAEHATHLIPIATTRARQEQPPARPLSTVEMNDNNGRVRGKVGKYKSHGVKDKSAAWGATGGEHSTRKVCANPMGIQGWATQRLAR